MSTIAVKPVVATAANDLHRSSRPHARSLDHHGRLRFPLIDAAPTRPLMTPVLADVLGATASLRAAAESSVRGW